MSSTTTVATLARTKAWVIDVDGCLVRTARAGGAGGEAMPRAAELIALLKAAGHRVVVCTNASQRPPREYADHLRHLGIGVEDEDFVTAGSAAADHVVAHHPGARVLVVGDDGITEPLRTLGVEPLDPVGSELADVVVVGAASSYSAALLNAACLAVDAGAPLYTTVDVPWFHGGRGKSVAVSATVAAAISWATGVPPAVVGKPSPYLGEALLRRLGGEPEETAVVGDAAVEIRLARAMGAASVLVLSGAVRPEQLHSLDVTPDVVCADVAELYRLLSDRLPTTQGDQR